MDFLDAVLAIHVSAIFGFLINSGLEDLGLKLPLFVTCLFAGILITNLIPKSFPRISGRVWPSRKPAIALIADVSLGTFLAMSLMSMQLWTLVDLAGPIFTILGAQFLIAVSLTLFVVFPLMGRSYDAAVVCAGFGGISLGSTPTAMANMSAVAQRYGASHLAFIIVPLVCAFLLTWSMPCLFLSSWRILNAGSAMLVGVRSPLSTDTCGSNPGPGAQRGVTGTLIKSCLSLLLLITAEIARATPEYIQSEETAPVGVDETVESIEHAFRLPRPSRLFTRLGDVFREGSLDLHLRNYYFHREREDDSNQETWAQGNGLTYETPWWENRLRLGAAIYGSQKLYGPQDQDGSKLLKPRQKSFAVPGLAFIDARLYRDLTLRAYRQKFSLPYLNGNDSRMVPNTFEALSLFDFSGENFVYGVTHTWRMKKRDASDFISMTEAAGIDGHDRGVSTAAARYTFSRGANLGMVNHYGKDYMNIFYTEVNSRARLLGRVGVQFSAQFTSQNSVGDELGGDFDTRSWGAKLATSYGGGVLTLAHTSTANDAAIQSSWGGKPSYLSLMIKDFDRAGEDAWLVGLSTDFRFFGRERIQRLHKLCLE